MAPPRLYPSPAAVHTANRFAPLTTLTESLKHLSLPDAPSTRTSHQRTPPRTTNPLSRLTPPRRTPQASQRAPPTDRRAPPHLVLPQRANPVPPPLPQTPEPPPLPPRHPLPPPPPTTPTKPPTHPWSRLLPLGPGLGHPPRAPRDAEMVHVLRNKPKCKVCALVGRYVRLPAAGVCGVPREGEDCAAAAEEWG